MAGCGSFCDLVCPPPLLVGPEFRELGPAKWPDLTTVRGDQGHSVGVQSVFAAWTGQTERKERQSLMSYLCAASGCFSTAPSQLCNRLPGTQIQHDSSCETHRLM